MSSESVLSSMDNNRQVGSDTQKVEVFNIEDGKRVTLDHDPQVIRNTLIMLNIEKI